MAFGFNRHIWDVPAVDRDHAALVCMSFTHMIASTYVRSRSNGLVKVLSFFAPVSARYRFFASTEDLITPTRTLFAELYTPLLLSLDCIHSGACSRRRYSADQHLLTGEYHRRRIQRRDLALVKMPITPYKDRLTLSRPFIVS